MSITLKPYLLKRRQKANGLYPIYIRITESGKYSLFSTGIDVELKNWNPKAKPGKWVKAGDHSADAFNSKIQNILTDIRLMIQENPKITRKQIVLKLKDSGNGEFISFAEQFIAEIKQKGQYHQQKHFRVLLNKLKAFRGNNIRFKDINVQFLEEFKEWLAKEQRDSEGKIIWKKNHSNTISKEMVRFKAMMKEAIKRGLTSTNPFDSPFYNKVKTTRSKKRALKVKQIDEIESLDLEKGSSLWNVRNYFLFSFYCAGIRFTDLALMKWDNIKDGRLVYQMGKNDKWKDIELMPPALKILEYYNDHPDTIENFIFPIIQQKHLTEIGLKKKASSANVMINRDLKEIQKLAGIDTNISFHIARHSFARWAKANNMPLDFIGKALAHSDRATTEQYLDDLSDYDMDNDMKELWQSKAKK